MVDSCSHSFRCELESCEDTTKKEVQVCLSLVGFSGAGKTAVTERLSSRYGLRCVDLDVAVEQFTGRLVSDIIRVEGIEAFRALEREVLTSLLKENYQVISLGGGALLSAGVKELVTKQTLCVEISAITSTIVDRVYQDEVLSYQNALRPLRPLLASDSSVSDEFGNTLNSKVPSKEDIMRRVVKLQDERRGLYFCAKIAIWTDYVSRDEIAKILIDEVALFESLCCLGFRRSIFPKLSFDGCHCAGTAVFVVGYGVINELVERVIRQCPDTKRVCLFYETNSELFADELANRFSHAGIEFVLNELAFDEVDLFQENFFAVDEYDVCVLLQGSDGRNIANDLSSFFVKFGKLYVVPTTLTSLVSVCAGIELRLVQDAEVVVDSRYILQDSREYLQAEGLHNNVAVACEEVVRNFVESIGVNVASLRSCSDDVLVQLAEYCVHAFYSRKIRSS